VNVPLLVLREARHRWPSALLATLAVAAAVALVHVFVLFGRATEQQTRMIQRDSGLNVVVLPAATSLDRYWTLGYSEHSMPQEYMQRVEGQAVANRLIPLLRRRVRVGAVDVMVTGIAGEVFKGGQRMKPVFGLDPAPGTCVVGGVVARALSLERGDELELLGVSFTVEQVLGEVGTAEDVVVYLGLAEAQGLFGLEGRINEIQALECHCGEEVTDPLAHLRATLEPLLPGTQILRQEDAADARREQRLLAERSLRVATPLVLVLCGLVVAVLAALNVRERREELGVLHALGHGPAVTGGVMLGRALLVGLVGALLGSLVGGVIAEHYGASIFQLGKAPIPEGASLLPLSLLLAPLFALAASLAPVLAAAAADPAEVLRRD
jgi:putative ABC transport system permease protein